MLYWFMSKDTILAVIEVTSTHAIITKQYQNMPPYIGNIDNWLESRTNPVGRQNISTLLKLAHIDKKEEYLKVTHAISMTDTFWVKRPGEDIRWKDISPYTNRFSRIISEVALNGGYYGGQLRSPSPEYTLDGSADKCWKRVDSKDYMYKTNGEKWSGLAFNRPYSEYYATQVAQALISDKSHYVKYNIKVGKTHEGNIKPYVYSKLFTSEQHGYLPIGDSIYAHTEISELDKVLDQESRVKLREMLVLDSLILNYDRHSWNYGFMVDNDTFDIKGMAPIFDQDCSLGCNVSLGSFDTVKDGYTYAIMSQPRTVFDSHIEQAKWAMLKELAINMKNMYPFKFERLEQSIDIEDKRIQLMEYIVNRQIREILRK